ncbi:MAG: tetratricopeptide repeat protein, partial [Elusimicrobia bacterium]|nr:tetratricopeptide repeat protein [Elusimicrobiota bacterium]MBD3412647.1 tetratricopeptide repeat protein [Elusimicrobiota bacterium]
CITGGLVQAADEAEVNQAFSLAASAFQSGRYESCLAECRYFLRNFPRHIKAVRVRYMQADALFQQEKYAEAADAFKKFIIENNRPSFRNLIISARLRLGECDFNLQKYLKAIDHFSYVSSQKNDCLRAEALFGLAYAHLARAEYDKAESFFLELLQSHPGYQNQSGVIVPLGLIYLDKGEIQRAVDVFSRNPTDVASLYYRGVCHRLMNQVISAAQLFKEVLDNDIEKKWSDKAMYQMGEAYFQSGEFPLAYDAFKKVYSTMLASPLRPYALFRMGCVNYQIGKYEQAAFNWSTLVKEYPENLSGPASQYLLAELNLRQNELSRALAGFSELQAIDEYGMDARYKMIWSLAVQSQYDAVISKADQFLRDFEWGELHAKVTLLKGLSQYLMGLEEDAIDTYQALIDRFPETIYHEKGLYLMTVAYFDLKRYAEIVTHVYQMLKIAPTSSSPWQAGTYYWVAEAYYQLGEYEMARQMYEMVNKNYRNTEYIPYVLLGIAACYARLGEYDRSIEMQAKAMEYSQEMENPEVKKSAVLDTADVLFNKREYEKAVNYYDEFVRKNPDDPRAEKALFQQGLALYRLEYFSEAIKKWSYLANHHRDSSYAPEAVFQTGRTYFGLGRYAEAIRTFQKLIDVYPRSGFTRDATLQLGQCYFNAGDIDQAILQYRAYLEKYPQDEHTDEVTELLQMCYYKQGKTAAELKELMVKFPASKFSADIFWELGAENFNRKNYDRALDYFERIILDFPESSQAKQAFFYKADAYFLSGEYRPAINNFKNYIINYPEEPLIVQARFKLGVSYFNLKDYLQAAVAFNDFLEMHPNDPKAMDASLNIPLCYRKAGQPYQAIETYNNFLRRYPESDKLPFVHLQIGQLYEEVEDYEKAIASYENISNNKTEIFEALYSIGRCYRKLKASGNEQKVYERLKRFSPKNNQFRLAGLVLLGEMYEQSGFIQNAVEVYQDIQSHSANKEWREIAREKIRYLQGN